MLSVITFWLLLSQFRNTNAFSNSLLRRTYVLKDHLAEGGTRTCTTQKRMSAVEIIPSTKQRKPRTALSVSFDNSRRQSHAIILNELSNEKTTEAAQKAEDFLFSLEADEDERKRLSVVHYASVINSWANVGEYSRAEAILDHMIGQVRDETIVSATVPNSHCFSGVMKAATNAFCRNKSLSDPNGSVSQQCEDLLEKMNSLYKETSNEDAKPNTVVYNSLLNAYAEEVTAIFLKLKMNDRKTLYPNVFQRQQTKRDEVHKGLVDRAVTILDEMEVSDGSLIPKPDKYSFCTVISLLAKCENLKMASLAESYLHRISDQFDTPTYNAVISAWASTGTIEGAMKANLLLERLEEAIENVDDSSEVSKNFGPNAISYFTVISAWVKSCSPGDGGHAALKAESILTRMESKLNSSRFSEKERIERFKPNVIAFSSTIDCWSKSGSADAAVHAKRLLDRMVSIGINPNVFTYTSSLVAYARSDSEGGAKEADALLHQMKEMYDETGDEEIKPTVVSYFAAIDAWARSDAKNAGAKAEVLLEEMESLYHNGDHGMRPDVRVYARVIAAHAKSRKKGSDKKALAVIRRMEAFTVHGDESMALAKPNVVCYNTLISSYATRGRPIQAFTVLNQVDQFNSRLTNEVDRVCADEHTLNGVILALSKSNLKGKARKAVKILGRLETSHIDGDWRAKPSTKSYNMVISACSNSFKADGKERAQALRIALDVFSRLKVSPYVETDRYTYISMLKVCGKLLPTSSAKRRKLVERIFKDCCCEGLVDDSVLSNFLIAAPKELSISLLGEDLLQNPRAQFLPKKWTNKVVTFR